ncbi:MAG: hypothetical protein IKT68_02605 [Clostridia bacterium]|nr:hypothetical protein [Clostridia bacterium]
MGKPIKFLSFILCVFLTVGTVIVPVAANELALAMEGKTFTASDGTTLPYRIYVPSTQAPEDGFSVYLHLHAEDGRGNDNLAQTTSGMELVNQIIEEKGEETIVVVPQCAQGAQWVDVPLTQGVYSINQVAETKYVGAVMELLEEMKTSYSVNTDQLYLGGHSMGAYGVWDLLARYPGTFAAAIPVCGGGDMNQTHSMKQVAIRTYHSTDDAIVPVFGTRNMVDSLKEVNGNISYEEFTDKGHEIWSRVYGMSDQVEWLFSQSLAGKPVASDFVQGDVDADGTINANDALMVLKSVVGKEKLTEDAALRADVNLDDAINAGDALDILKYVVGKIKEFPQREISNEPLVDTSTGEISPRLVAATYTKEPIVADIIPSEDGYIVRGDGAVDCTAGIQKALNHCEAAGGGTVYLPAGEYMITGSLTIPARVALVGDWNDPDTMQDDNYGTVIVANVPSKDTKEGGLFNLGGSGGVVGLTVYYPNQSLDAVKPYPAVFYTDGRGGNYMLSTIKNCTVINGYRGIGACCHTVNPNAHEQLTVENVKGTFLYTAAEVYNQADVGTWENVVVSGRYWANAKGRLMHSVDQNAVNTYTSANTAGMTLGDLEWTEFSGLTIEHCNIGLKIVKGQRIQFAGSLYNISITDCSTGILVQDLDPRWGMLIANSVVENGIQNNTSGLVKLVNVTLSGAESSGSVELAQESQIQDIALPKITRKQPQSHFIVANLAKDGKTDVSAALQKLLNEMSSTGGIVYLPAGAYRLDQPISVPGGVQLRGSATVATRGFDGNGKGTIILSYYGDDLEEEQDPLTEQALITLNGDHAGLYGIRITYPKNGPHNKNLKTTYAVRGNGKGVYAENLTITAAGYGIDFRKCDDHVIKKVVTCCYYNTFLVGGNNGIITGCLQNGTVIERCGDPELKNWLADGEDIFAQLFNPILRENAKYIIVDKGSNQTIYNTFVYGCNTMITIKGAEELLMVNVGSDNLGISGAQFDMKSGSATVINAMRYNGRSYRNNGGKLGLYNRLAIDYTAEKNGIY